VEDLRPECKRQLSGRGGRKVLWITGAVRRVLGGQRGSPCSDCTPHRCPALDERDGALNCQQNLISEAVKFTVKIMIFR